MSDQVERNQRRAMVLLGAYALGVFLVLAAFCLLVGLGLLALVVGLIGAGALAAVAYQRAEAIAVSLGRAVPADPQAYARLHNLVDGLCISSGATMPDILVVEDDAPNGFVAGRNPKRASLAVTTGLLDQLERVELEGVLAHLLSQIRSNQVAVDTLAVSVAGWPTLLADRCIRTMWWNGGRKGHDDPAGGTSTGLGKVGTTILAASPALAGLLHRSIGEDRTAQADIAAIEMTRYPPGLIDALSKLEATSTVSHAGTRVASHLWMAAPIALTPDDGELADRNQLFDRHPSLEGRIAFLREL